MGIFTHKGGKTCEKNSDDMINQQFNLLPCKPQEYKTHKLFDKNHDIQSQTIRYPVQQYVYKNI